MGSNDVPLRQLVLALEEIERGIGKAKRAANVMLARAVDELREPGTVTPIRPGNGDDDDDG